MKTNPGTYALLLRSVTNRPVQIGRWDELELARGFYIYVGSAFGPGGVRARVLRHCRENTKKHWHIDYLRNFSAPLGAWYCHGSRHLEHRWAKVLLGAADISPIKGFGCSDCACYSHLFFTKVKPCDDRLSAILGKGTGRWVYGSSE